jgi:hypothetical protein
MAKLGPTGEYPRGKLGEDDMGELNIRVTADRSRGIVEIAFGASVTWLGMPAGDARVFALALLKCADALEERKDVVN